MKYLSTGNDPKTTKGESLGIKTAILYLAPAKEAGGRNLCPHASPGCLAACIYTAGHGRMQPVKNARIRKTRAFFDNPKRFVEELAFDVREMQIIAERAGMRLAIRLNGTSDIPWENLGGETGQALMDRFPEVQWYDYTKNPARALKHARGEMPANYFLAFSRSECNDEAVGRIMRAGGSVAAVFDLKKSEPFPKTWGGKRVVDGDAHDAIFEHGAGVVIGLRAKGEGKRDASGFVINLQPSKP